MGELCLRNLGKAYRQYVHPLARLAEWVGFGTRHQLNWVLKGIDLDIAPGSSLGVVGRNGAGKSTLLKLITGVAKPTEGEINCTGRIAALLELGMGFHPEFTGRQNVLMQGYLQGTGHDQMAALMPEIEAFAEVGDYFDRPVRTYSSGMQMRVAFSVATALRPDILIVDEALSVGDAYFQHKCFDRIRLYRDRGTTLLFVSHDPAAVRALCDRAILLDGGGIACDGAPADVLDYYNALIAPRSRDHAISAHGEEQKGMRSGDGSIRIGTVELWSRGMPQSSVFCGEPSSVRVTMRASRALPDFTVGLLIKDRLGNDIFGTNTYHIGEKLGPIADGDDREVEFTFPSLGIGPGNYSITIAIHASTDHLAGNYDWWDRALVFQVMPTKGTNTIGACYMPMHFIQRKIHASQSENT